MEKKLIKVNLGSGPSGIVGWLNFDWGLLPLLGKLRINKLLVNIGLLGHEYAKVWSDLSLCDIRNKLPLKSKSVKYVYCSHVLEHMSKSETKNILKEVRRVLVNKGVVRILLPDLDKIYKIYGESEKFNDVFMGFPQEMYTGFLGKLKSLFIRPHKWMYTKSTFKKVLVEAGFTKIKFCEHGKGECVDLDQLDLPGHKELSFYVEASN